MRSKGVGSHQLPAPFPLARWRSVANFVWNVSEPHPGAGGSGRRYSQLQAVEPYPGEWDGPGQPIGGQAGSRANVGFRVCHLPRVKSGHSTGTLPRAIDFSDSEMIEHMVAES